MTSPKGITKYS